MLTQITEQLARGVSLSAEQIEAAVQQLVDDRLAAECKADFLSALARKGETIEEIAGFARALRERSIVPILDPATRQREILDVVGTGGDRLHTFNISTTVAILVAASGVTVAKHGNRAVTSKTGSADVLEALGIRTNLSPIEAGAWLRDYRFAFFFAPGYHPAFKHIGPARKLCAERGQHTIFNFLGPLLNPVRPTAQLIGVSQPALCEPMARVLQSLGVRRGMIVCGQTEKGCIDELSTLGDTTVAEFYQPLGLSTSTLSPRIFSLQRATLADLTGGDREANALIVRHLLQGKDRGPRRDAVLLNAAAALLIANQVRSLPEGWDQAARLIDDGQAAAKLEELVNASRL